MVLNTRNLSLYMAILHIYTQYFLVLMFKSLLQVLFRFILVESTNKIIKLQL